MDAYLQHVKRTCSSSYHVEIYNCRAAKYFDHVRCLSPFLKRFSFSVCRSVPLPQANLGLPTNLNILTWKEIAGGEDLLHIQRDLKAAHDSRYQDLQWQTRVSISFQHDWLQVCIVETHNNEPPLN